MLQAVSIGKSVGSITLVDDISLAVQPGEIVGLIGPGGAGKTTTFRLLTGILLPDHGQIILDGVDITHLPVFERARRGLGFLPQEPSVIHGMTVEQNILLALETRHDYKQRRTVLDSLLNFFKLTALRHASAAHLSGGERRRCEIARALACNPSFILLDEPFAGVDPINVQEVRKLIEALRHFNIGILITDHNARELLGSVDRAYVIDSGRVLMSGRPHDIINDATVRRIYLGDEFSSPL